jgi:hypothetical protein
MCRLDFFRDTLCDVHLFGRVREDG